MLEIIYAVIFIWPVIFNTVSARSINCYMCAEGIITVPITNKDFEIFRKNVTRNIQTSSTDLECSTPFENSKTFAVNAKKYSCIKISAKCAMKVENKTVSINITIRSFSPEGLCRDLEEKDLGVSLDCYECKEDKCNSASLIHMSVLVYITSTILFRLFHHYL